MLRACLHFHSGHREWLNCPMTNGQPTKDLWKYYVTGWDNQGEPLITSWQFCFVEILEPQRFAVYKQIG